MPAKPVQKVSARAAENAFDNLDLSELTQRYDSDDSISAREAIRRFYWQIVEMRDRGLTYVGICEFLAENLELTLSPNTLKAYIGQLAHSRNLPPKPKSAFRSKPSQASTSVQPQAPSQPAAIAPTPPVPPIAPPPSLPVVTPKPPAAKSAPANHSSAVATQSTLARSETSSAKAGDAAPIEEFTPQELELALQIPQPGDEAGLEKFRQALQQLKTIDAGRWRRLKIEADNQGVNVLGILRPSSAHLFNQY